jgi:hypothetical protein
MFYQIRLVCIDPSADDLENYWWLTKETAKIGVEPVIAMISYLLDVNVRRPLIK